MSLLPLETMIVKVTDGTEIRRYTVNATSDMTYKGVLKRTSELFGLAAKDVKLQYKDDEGDLITVSMDDEMAEAVKVARTSEPYVLRLTVTGKPVNQNTYGEYVAVERFDQPVFWPERERMGYEYHQRGFESFAAMLNWCAQNNVDWGWKEGNGSYGQLFYQKTVTAHTPSFGASLKLWEGDVNFMSNVPAGSTRIGFVKKSLLLAHPSWADTAARAAYVRASAA